MPEQALDSSVSADLAALYQERAHYAKKIQRLVDEALPLANKALSISQSQSKGVGVQIGGCVEVCQAFEGNSTGEMRKTLQKGCHGVVRRLDNDADALIDFYIQGCSGDTFVQWVLKSDFDKLDVKAPVSSAQICVSSLGEVRAKLMEIRVRQRELVQLHADAEARILALGGDVVAGAPMLASDRCGLGDGAPSAPDMSAAPPCSTTGSSKDDGITPSQGPILWM